MARVERTIGEQKRVGQPSNQTRIDLLERTVARLVAIVVAAGDIQGDDRLLQDATNVKTKLDQLDTDEPVTR